MTKNIDIGGRLHSTATGNIVTGANEIYDDNKNKKQSEINIDIDNALADRYTKAETYNKTELNNMITTPNQQYVSVTANSQTTAATDILPATGAPNTIYRVGNWDGSQFDASVYSEYAWNGSAYIKLSTKLQVGEVFDISVYHVTGGVLAKYANLTAALDSNNGGGVPQSLQKGGMSVKFVQSSDNKYVQYRLTTQSFSTNVDDWTEGGGGDGIYDISASHSGATYADLAAALGTNGANVPSSIRKGGMSVKFIRDIPATYYVLRTEGVEEVPSGGVLLESTPSIYNDSYTASQLSAFSTLPESTSADAVVYYVAVTVNETTTYTTWSITMVSVDVQKYEHYRYTLPYENTTAGNNNFKNTVNWQKESVFENDSDSVDFSLKDEKGNVIFQIANGHIKTKFFDSSQLNNRTHWYGKKWFAYGTSMTNTGNEGWYPGYIDRLSGLIRTNRGFSGGGITTRSNQAIYNAICSMDDNKDTADLITLEIGANDDNAPLGDFTSYTDNSTLIGALILCIRYLQEHTNAQIVVFPSPHQRKIVFPRTVICDGTQTFGSDNHTMLDRDDAIRKVCMMYDVPFIAPCSNLGYARMNASDLYNRDQIHHTELGGLNYALSIWSHLKNIYPFIVYEN